MISTIGRVATILALCFSLGLQWLALQSVAWTTMLLENARHGPLTEAVAKTFDGAHPCGLCHVVSAGTKSEKKSEVLPSATKMDLLCTTRQVICLPPFFRHTYANVSIAVPQRLEAPPAPPPRPFLA